MTDEERDAELRSKRAHRLDMERRRQKALGLAFDHANMAEGNAGEWHVNLARMWADVAEAHRPNPIP